jgi:hypothetical protein
MKSLFKIARKIIRVSKHPVKELVFNNPSVKGARGEFKAAWRLSNLPSEYKVLNNINIKSGNKSSQIDHVVISPYGIFVIETKNYSGWIFGSENQEYWTQTIYKEKNKLFNPVKQNKGHVNALKRVLSVYKDIKYYPIVVFTGDAELKSITSSVPVIYKNQLRKTIKNLSATTCLSEIQVGAIVDRLKMEDSIAPTMREHKKQVRDTIHDQEQKEKTLVCPKCGSDLKSRSGKYGKFYGCSNYPKCKYTRKMN